MKPTCRELLDGGWTNADMDELAARVEKVLALHQAARSPFTGDPMGWCKGCEMTWPCPTVRALDGEK